MHQAKFVRKLLANTTPGQRHPPSLLRWGWCGRTVSGECAVARASASEVKMIAPNNEMTDLIRFEARDDTLRDAGRYRPIDRTRGRERERKKKELDVIEKNGYKCG